jgi:hypothetical protein
VETATCEKCGSDDLRSKRARTPLRRLYRSLTGQQRYGCNACHHRGWSDLPLASHDAQEAREHRGQRSVPGRKTEHRDLVATRQVRRAQAIAVGAALLLGALIAAVIAGSCG